MSGYSTYQRLQRIEAQAKMLGFRLSNPKHGHWGGSGDSDQVALYPNDEALPVYSRDAEIFVGSFRDVEIFLTGWVRAQSYDTMLRLSDEKKRVKAEDRERARQAEQQKKEEQKQMMAVLRASDAENRAKKK